MWDCASKCKFLCFVCVCVISGKSSITWISWAMHLFLVIQNCISGPVKIYQCHNIFVQVYPNTVWGAIHNKVRHSILHQTIILVGRRRNTDVTMQQGHFKEIHSTQWAWTFKMSQSVDSRISLFTFYSSAKQLIHTWNTSKYFFFNVYVIRACFHCTAQCWLTTVSASF